MAELSFLGEIMENAIKPVIIKKNYKKERDALIPKPKVVPLVENVD